MIRQLLCTVALTSLFGTDPLQAQFRAPPPRPTGPQPLISTTLPTTVLPQSPGAPIPTNPFLRPIPPKPISPIYPGGFIPVYPFGGFGGYGGQVINQSVNLNINIVPPDNSYVPRSWANPLYGNEPARPVSLTKARLIVQVPLNAEVVLNGEKTKQEGPERVFESPDLTNGNHYTFDLIIRWQERGKIIEETRKLTLGASESRTIVYFAR